MTPYARFSAFAMLLVASCRFDLTVIPTGDGLDDGSPRDGAPADGTMDAGSDGAGSDGGAPSGAMDGGSGGQGAEAGAPDAGPEAGSPGDDDPYADLLDDAIIATRADVFQARWQAAQARGLCPIEIETFESGSARGFATAMRASSAPCRVTIERPWAELAAEMADARAAGLSLTDLEIYRVSNEPRFAAVFEGGRPEPTLLGPSAQTPFIDAWRAAEGAGQRLFDLNIYLEGDVRTYVGLALPSAVETGSYINATWGQFYTHWQDVERAGYVITELDVRIENGVELYSGLFAREASAHAAWVGSPFDGFATKWRAFSSEGYAPVDFEIVSRDGGELVFSGLFRLASTLGQSEPPLEGP